MSWILLPVGITFLQFQLAFIFQYPITVGLLVLPFLMFTLFRPVLPVRNFVIILLLLEQSILNFLLNPNENPAQFVRTFILVAICILFVSISISSPLKLPSERLLNSLSTIFFGFTLLSGMQYFLGDYIPTLNRPFGRFTNYYALLNSTYGEHFRSTAFFNEPSYNALVASSFIPFIFYRFSGTKRSIYLTAGLAYVFFAHSLAGILLYGVLTSANFFSKSSSKKILIFALPTFVFLLSNFITERSSSINIPGSSSNFRLIAPILAAKKIVPENPFGIVLGSLERHMHVLGFLNGTSIGTSLDNGIFLIILYFGLVGLLAVILVFSIISIKMNQQLKQGNKDWSLLLIPPLMLLFTGGVFTPEFVLILSFAIYFIRIGIDVNSSINSEVRKTEN